MRMRTAILTVAAVTALATANAGANEGVRIDRTFVERGDELVLDCAKGDGVLASTRAVPPGYHKFTCEIKTPGFDPMGKFAVDMKTPDWKTGLSGYSWNSTASDWVPFVLFFRAEKSTNFIIRFGNFQGKRGGAHVHLRSVTHEKFDMPGEVNWLDNGDFELGVPGEVPPLWEWKGDNASVDRYALARNTTFRRGSNVVRLMPDAKNSRLLSSRGMPLPSKGELVFTTWARTDAESGHLTMHLVCDGWNPRAEGGGSLNGTWKELTTKLQVPTDGKKKWFFVRYDAKSTDAVEIADAKVIWYPKGKKSEKGKTEVHLGWPGAPGKNMILNPDMELGGVGYYHDFSWPKKLDHYRGGMRAKPVLFLEGQGVDGGTCANVRGADMRAWCFPVEIGATYTYSVSLRAPRGTGKAEAMIVAFDSEWRCGLWKKVTDIPEDRWKRYSWTDKWKNHNIQKRSYIRIGGSNVLVDRLQVVKGTLSEYEAPPVMLGLVFDRMQYFVRGRDEMRAKIKVVPGVKNNGSTEITVVSKDAWGREAWKRTLTAPLNRTTLHEVDLSDSKLGTFHVELNATIDGETAGIGIARYAVIDPPLTQHTKPGDPGLFGICQESFNITVWLCEDHAKIHTDLGIRMNRFFASVPPDLPHPLPEWWTQELLAKCKPFNDARIDLMPCVELIPRSTADAVANTGMPKQADYDAWEKFLRAYVRALSPQVRYFEIFNEPNLWRVSKGPEQGKRTMFPKKYFEFQKIAYRVIKKIDPDLQVVCNALNNLPQDWIEEWMKLGAGRYMDLFSFHPYGWTNFFPESIRLRKQLASHGFTKPIINTEKYYGTNFFYDRAGYEETRRGYYLPHDGELRTAGRSMRHMISHAADRVPYCPYAPSGTIFRRGPGTEIFLYDFFSAYNAATRFLVEAGHGDMIDMGPSMTAFVFPEAVGGPLLVVWTPLGGVEASMQGLEGDYSAYDIMGNRYASRDLKDGIRVANEPTYIRFRRGATADSIETALASADVLGLGDPFKVDLAITGADKVTATVTSWRNKPQTGVVRIMNLPKGWKARATEKPFTDLPAGKSAKVDFMFDRTDIRNLGTYTMGVMAESGASFVRRDVTIRPLFANSQRRIRADGRLSDWRDATWVTLGRDHLSKDFNPEIAHGGDRDLSARIACGWNRDSFALAIEVIDDTHRPAESERVAWKGDSVQIYFDPKNDASATTGSNTGEDVAYTMSLIRGMAYAWVDKGAQGNYKGPANKAEAFHDADVQLAIVRGADRTVYEMVFPKTKCIPAASLVEGGNFGFSILINDNDGRGRKTGLTLAPKGKEPYGAPHEYRDMMLRR